MNNSNITMIILVLINYLFIGCIVYLFILLCKALKKYISSSTVKKEEIKIKKSLGSVLRSYRLNNKMTQEFVAEYIGVSRQSVSKWEQGISEPSTSNLLALSKLYGVSANELLKEVE